LTGPDTELELEEGLGGLLGEDRTLEEDKIGGCGGGGSSGGGGGGVGGGGEGGA